MAKQVQAGHMAVLPLEAVTSLQNLWLLSVAVTLQVGRRLCLIFDFTWIGQNNTAECLSPIEEMRFGVHYYTSSRKYSPLTHV